MSTTTTNTTNQQGADTPKVSEKTESTDKHDVKDNKTEVKMEVDPVTTNGDAKPSEATTKQEDKTEATTNGDSSTTVKVEKNGTSEKKGTDDEDRPRINGAAKKRFKWLLARGYERTEAMELAKDAAAVNALREKDKKTGTKRKLDSDSGPVPFKLPKNFIDDGPSVMTVAPKDYPKTMLTRSQGNIVQSKVLKMVMEQKNAEVKPQFEGSNFVDGYVRFNCADGPTRMWLDRAVHKLEFWEGASVKLCAEKNLLKFDVYLATFEDSASEKTEDLLNFIEAQNKHINISKWGVLGRKQQGPKRSVELKLGVDLESSKTIDKAGGTLNFKFQKIQLRKIKSAVVAKRAPNPPPVQRRSGPPLAPSGPRGPVWSQGAVFANSSNNRGTMPSPNTNPLLAGALGFGLIDNICTQLQKASNNSGGGGNNSRSGGPPRSNQGSNNGFGQGRASRGENVFDNNMPRGRREARSNIFDQNASRRFTASTKSKAFDRNLGGRPAARRTAASGNVFDLNMPKRGLSLGRRNFFGL